MASARMPAEIVDTLPDQDKRCKGGCGFYGHEMWGGFCSVCKLSSFSNAPTSSSTSASFASTPPRTMRQRSSAGPSLTEDPDGEDLGGILALDSISLGGLGGAGGVPGERRGSGGGAGGGAGGMPSSPGSVSLLSNASTMSATSGAAAPSSASILANFSTGITNLGTSSPSSSSSTTATTTTNSSSLKSQNQPTSSSLTSSPSSIFSILTPRKSTHKRSSSSGEAHLASTAGRTGSEGGAASAASAASDDALKKSAANVNFLKSLKPTAAQDVTQQVKTFMAQFNEARDITQAGRAEHLQRFFASMQERIERQPVWDGALPDDGGKYAVLDAIARMVQPQIYDRIFFCNSQEREADIALHTRIQRLQWVDEATLEARIDPSNADAMSYFSAAQNELIVMDARRTSQEKLHCISACCKALFRVLEVSAGGGAKHASADDLLPLLIYTVLRANPPFFKGNLQFITNYSPPHQLQSGEAAYYYTNLYGALSFIENVTGAQLHMTEGEFTARMSDASMSDPAIVHLAKLRNHRDRLQRLVERQKTMKEEVTALNEVIDALVGSPVLKG